eukprot:TRINITY_DN5491_c0_g1_i1.p1 TRINITY_DN5491_c0_g1~~TRINITY_DN5491_c0_g1_i1.p1  ORF type:complete len:513 (-),score=201.49 TRINITY_DN5491_c0_g1_i1:164-1702(-)
MAAKMMISLLLGVLALTDAFSLSKTLGDHMVLQRDTPATVWGFAASGTVVTTTFQGIAYKSVADSTGTWRQKLPPQPATANAQSITFASSDGGSGALNDVLFGDVHICSGQSNMQFTLLSNAGVPNVSLELSAANKYPLIRLFTVGQGTSSPKPLTDLATVEQLWSVASNSSVGVGGWTAFSAVCWFTYRDVFDALGGTVPFGLISNNWGGTPIQHWSSPDALKVCNGSTDSTLWNAMVNPYTVGPMAVRTAIWYQGEANVGQALYYDCQFPAMIADWRAKLPGLSTFGFVQIAACSTCYGVTPAAGDLRQSQLSPVWALPKIAFAISNDLVVPWSDPADIHPTNKQGVSTRLAAQMLEIEYGVDTIHSYPLYAGATTSTQGTQVTVTVALTGCAKGCYVLPETWPASTPAGAFAGWEIQVNDANGSWLNATATPTADGQGLVLTVTAPSTGLAAVATAYGRASWPITAAYNSNGLPVVAWCYTLDGRICYKVPELALPEEKANVYDHVFEG